MTRALLPALFAACVDVPAAAPTCDPGEDEDGDGWPCDGRVPDCDDGDAWRSPGQTEDGVLADRDCDPVTGFPGALPTLSKGGGVPSVTTGGVTFVLTGDRLVDLIEGQESILSDSVVEGGAGLALYPETARGWPGYLVTGDVETFTPVAVHLREDVTAELGDGATLSGVIDWWFYVGGRVVRSDRATLATPLPPGTEPRVLSSYLSLRADRYYRLQAVGREPITIPSPPEATTSPVTFAPAAGGWVCAEDLGRDVGVTWLDRGGAGPRVTFGDDGRLAFEYDWARDDAGTIAAGTRDAVTMIDFDDGGDGTPPYGCDAFADAAERFHASAPELDATGAYVVDGGEAPYAELIFDDVTEDVFVRARFLDEDGAGVTVWRDGERLHAGVDYRISYAPSEALVWLPHEQPAGTTIRVAAPGGEP